MKQKKLPLDLGEVIPIQEAERRLKRNRASFIKPILKGTIRAFDSETNEPTTNSYVTTMVCWEDARKWSETAKRHTPRPDGVLVKSAPDNKSKSERVKIVAHLPNGDDVRFEISLTAFSKVLAATIGGSTC